MTPAPPGPPVAAGFAEADPFDLPEWLGVSEVTWQADADIDHRGQVAGQLRSGASVDASPEPMPCDLIAVDVAVPLPAVTDQVRRAAHLAWRDGQVLVGELDGRTALAVPGVEFDSVLVVETLRRLCKAVGANGDRWLVSLRIGATR